MSRTSRKSSRQSRQTRPRRPALLWGGALLVVVIGIALLIGLWNTSEVNLAAAPPGFDPDLRTVVVAEASEPLPQVKSEQRFMMSELRVGAIPMGMIQATVLTDNNCEPDAQGVSHCLNELQMGDVRFTVQHHHNMMEVPCMSPGEQVNVISVETYHALQAS